MEFEIFSFARHFWPDKHPNLIILYLVVSIDTWIFDKSIKFKELLTSNSKNKLFDVIIFLTFICYSEVLSVKLI